jgi:sugar phosphate isomerase/epimerase
MKLAMMARDVGNLIDPTELRPLDFHAIQMFFGAGPDGDVDDPSPDTVDAVLQAAAVTLAAIAVHVDLVDAHGAVQADVDRALRCVHKTAALDGRFGDNPTPLMIWHPSAYPAGADIDDARVFAGLCEALGAVARAAEHAGVRVAIEITRAGSVGGAEAFLRLHDHIASDALCVCMDPANFTPDRTPLERAVRMLAPHTVIAHGKDVRFADTGLVAEYGPTGTGTLDYPAYLRALQAHTDVPYFVLEYYRTREALLKGRDIVLQSLSGEGADEV